MAEVTKKINDDTLGIAHPETTMSREDIMFLKENSEEQVVQITKHLAEIQAIVTRCENYLITLNK